MKSADELARAKIREFARELLALAGNRSIPSAWRDELHLALKRRTGRPPKTANADRDLAIASAMLRYDIDVEKGKQVPRREVFERLQATQHGVTVGYLHKIASRKAVDADAAEILRRLEKIKQREADDRQRWHRRLQRALNNGASLAEFLRNDPKP